MTYHDDGSTSTQRVTGEKVYFRAPAMRTTSVRRPPATTSQEMVEVEVEEDQEVEAQPTTSGLARVRWHGGWKERRCTMCAVTAQRFGTPRW